MPWMQSVIDMPFCTQQHQFSRVPVLSLPPAHELAHEAHRGVHHEAQREVHQRGHSGAREVTQEAKTPHQRRYRRRVHILLRRSFCSVRTLDRATVEQHLVSASSRGIGVGHGLPQHAHSRNDDIQRTAVHTTLLRQRGKASKLRTFSSAIRPSSSRSISGSNRKGHLSASI